MDDILGRRSEDNDDEDWETLLMVEQLKASVPKPKPKASSGPLTQVQQKKAQESSIMMQRREFARSFKLAADAVLGEDLIQRKQKTKSQSQWSRIRVSTKLAAAVAERRR